MVNYIILYKKFVEHHVIKLILLKISKLSARLTQAIIRDKLQRLKHTQDICLHIFNPSARVTLRLSYTLYSQFLLILENRKTGLFITSAGF